MKIDGLIRKDGTVNLTKFGRQALGVKAGVHVDMNIVDGSCIITPRSYVCAICGKSVPSVVDQTGTCVVCNNTITSLIRSDKQITLGQAIATVARGKAGKYKAY